MQKFKNKRKLPKASNDRKKPSRPSVSHSNNSSSHKMDDETLFQDMPPVKRTKTSDVPENEPVDDDFDDEDLDFENEDLGFNKETIERLKEKDPEFYNYLQNNDKGLLDFDDEDLEDEDDGGAEEDEPEEETPEEEAVEEKITLNRVKVWRKILKSPQSKADNFSTIKSVIKAFRKTTQQTTDSADDGAVSMLSPAIFNEIVNTVLEDLLPAILRYLRLETIANKTDGQEDDDEEEEEAEEDAEDQKVKGQKFYDPRRSKNWKRLQAPMKSYLTDVLKMMTSLSADARASFGRHVLELTPYYNVFPHLIKRLIKTSMNEWSSSSDDSNRVLASLILHRTLRVLQSNNHLTGTEKKNMMNQIFRRLYLSYVGVAKNTNSSTIAQVTFMKNSLVELYRLDDQLAYQHAFIFIRQLAINLRASFIMKEKNSIKTVYNWQYVHSILLWTQLICATQQETDVLEPLICPLITVISGTIRLLPSIRFIPLRFQLIRALNKLSAETKYFIPVLRFFAEIYNFFDPNKVKLESKKGAKKGKGQKRKHDDKDDEMEVEAGKGKKSMKDQDLDVMLKVTKEQSQEPEFVAKVVAKIHELCLQYLVSQSHSISFPETVSLFVPWTKKFTQTIRHGKETTVMKDLIEKVQQNAEFITQKRKAAKFRILDAPAVTAWERELKQNKSTPLLRWEQKRAGDKATKA